MISSWCTLFNKNNGLQTPKISRKKHLKKSVSRIVFTISRVSSKELDSRVVKFIIKKQIWN